MLAAGMVLSQVTPVFANSGWQLKRTNSGIILQVIGRILMVFGGEECMILSGRKWCYENRMESRFRW